MTEASESSVGDRSARKREVILATATSSFLRNGFRGTSMDEIASLAGVSKQTVYKQFADKERLFREIVEGVSANAATLVTALSEAFGQVPAATRDELATRLHRVGRTYIDGVLQPQVLALRRLIISEADQFPDLASRYYEHGPAQGIRVVAKGLQPYLESELITADDVHLAAAHFAYLTLAISHDRAMFVPADLPSAEEREHHTSRAVTVFLAAYGRAGAPPGRQGRG